MTVSLETILRKAAEPFRAAAAKAVSAVLRPEAPFGISVLVRARDEEDWIEPSIRSLMGFADQVVVADDGSVDGTPEILHGLREEFPAVLEVLTQRDEDIGALTRRLLGRARYRWVLRWEPDMVGQTAGPDGLPSLRRWLEKLPRRHFAVSLPVIELSGDLRHQNPASALRAEERLFTMGGAALRSVDASGRGIPLWYARRRWERPSVFQLQVKSDRRLFINGLWKSWLPRSAELPSFQSFMSDFCLNHFGVEDLDLCAEKWMALYVGQLTPVDEKYFPALPALLAQHLKNPKYRLVREKGRAVRRETSA